MSAIINTMMAVRTDFSVGESTLSPERIKDACLELGQSCVVITDTMNISHLVSAAKIADEHFQPRLGVRLCIVDDLEARNKRERKVYPKVYAKNWEGLQAIFRAISKGFEEDHFYYVPRLSWDELFNLVASDNVAVSTGDMENIFTHPDYQRIIRQLRVLKSTEDDLYIELTPIPTAYHDRCNARALECVFDFYESSLKVPTLVTMPTFHNKDQFDPYFVNMGIAKRSVIGKEYTTHVPYYRDFAPHDVRELVNLCSKAKDRIAKMYPDLYQDGVWRNGLENTKSFYGTLEYKWKALPISLPKLADDPNDMLKRLCVSGLKKRVVNPVFGETIKTSEVYEKYLPRLKYELSVIEKMGFADYFLVVHDLVQWSKDGDISVGPARGSVGGSLVAFLMGITDINPIRFDLIFERFLNPDRNDYPDIDLDFMSTRREEVREYLEEKYGKEHVAAIANYMELGSASSMKDVGRVFGMDTTKITASKLVPKVHGQPVDLETAFNEVADIQTFAEDNPEVWVNALELQGVMRGYSKHAAGLVVSQCPLTDRGVVEVRSGSRTVNWDKKTSEDMGLVKLDVLGLSTLDTIGKTLRFIEKRHGMLPDITQISLDDEMTLKMFALGKTVGVFQFEGGAAKRILMDMSRTKPITFDDIVAANALNRPGPIDAGLNEQYIGAKNDDFEVELPHENMERALRDTYNVIVYQEQVMQVAVDLAGFTFAESDKLRKAMGKKDPELMATFRDKFVEGCFNHSEMESEAARDLFDQIEVFAGYAFNKSHAAAYSLISYQCMWLKTHYPVEFFAGALSTVGEDKLNAIVVDALSRGIKVLPPDINQSEEEFVIADDKTLITPFQRVKRASLNACKAILEVREDGKIKSREDLETRLTEKGLKRKCNKAVLDNLEAVGAFANLYPSSLSPLDDDRLKDQLRLMPGLVSRNIHADRSIPDDKYTMARLNSVLAECEDAESEYVKPRMGKNPKFMVISDYPAWSEEKDGVFTKGKSFEYSNEALIRSGLKSSDAYWTGLLKAPKNDKMISTDEIKRFQPCLYQELEILKPAVILTLGSQSARELVPDLKGGIFDHAGKVIYSDKLDASIVIGFNPMMCYFDPDKIEMLTHVFSQVSDLISSL